MSAHFDLDWPRMLELHCENDRLASCQIELQKLCECLAPWSTFPSCPPLRLDAQWRFLSWVVGRANGSSVDLRLVGREEQHLFDVRAVCQHHD